MFGYFKNRKARKEKERLEAIAANKERADKVKLELKVSKENMLSSPCAINDMHKCKEECVHFEDGYTYTMPDFNGGLFNMIEYPRCKLWAAR